MSQLAGRYVISRILGPFGLLSLILLALVWLTQSLRVIETAVASGESAIVFLEFAALLLPLVMSFILPIAAFGAALFALNRMSQDSEVVVLMSAGLSRLALARPVALFGAGVMLAMAVVTTVLMPTAARELRGRIAEVGTDLAGSLLREGEFLFPADGVSVYVRAAGADGWMAGLFVQDDRDPEARLTYTAERAALVRGEESPRLVMFDGAAQRLSREDGTLSVLDFEKLVYDLAQLMPQDRTRTLKPSEYHAPALIAPTEAMLESGRPRGEYLAEGHEQLSAPLYAVTLPLIALASLLGPGFRRRGQGRRIAAAIALAALCRLAGVAAKSAATGAAALWPLMYAPPLVGAGLALLVLWRGLPRLPRPGPAAAGAGP